MQVRYGTRFEVSAEWQGARQAGKPLLCTYAKNPNQEIGIHCRALLVTEELT